MILTKKGENFVFSCVLFDGREDRFVKLDLIDTSNNQNIGTYTVNHLDSGIYLKSDIPANVKGVFLAKFEVFADVGLTKPLRKYEKMLKYYRVESIVDDITEVVDFGDGSAS